MTATGTFRRFSVICHFYVRMLGSRASKIGHKRPTYGYFSNSDPGCATLVSPPQEPGVLGELGQEPTEGFTLFETSGTPRRRDLSFLVLALATTTIRRLWAGTP